MSDEAEVRAYIIGTRQLDALPGRADSDEPNTRALAAFERIQAENRELEDRATKAEEALRMVAARDWYNRLGAALDENRELREKRDTYREMWMTADEALKDYAERNRELREAYENSKDVEVILRNDLRELREALERAQSVVNAAIEWREAYSYEERVGCGGKCIGPAEDKLSLAVQALSNTEDVKE